MAIDLLNTFLQKGQSVSTQSKGDTAVQASQTPQNMQLIRAVRALQAGQTIQGEILSVKGDEVQLSVMNQMVLEARLEQSMNLTPGTLMAFQIKSNNSSGLSLMPLFTNTAVDPNAMKALDMAGIPLTEKTLEMVKTLMQRGLPIDRQSLQEVYREVMAFKDANPADIISLRQMNIPVTSENLQQLSLYENNQHFLSDTFSDIGRAIGNQLSTWMQTGNTQTAQAFLGELRQIFTQIAGEEAAGETAHKEVTRQTVSGQGIQTIAGEASAKAALEELPAMGKNIVISERALTTEAAAAGEELSGNTGNKAGGEKTGTILQNGWDQLMNLLSQPKAAPKAAAAFQKLWNQEIKPQLLLEPGQVMEKEKVQEFYEKLSHQVKELESLADKHAQAAPLAKAVQNTAANLDFMNQLNQMHAYIQLPLKLSGQEAKGELYVFTNKRSMAREDGRVTALLHLDMEYLGKLDVFVALENQKVSTQFYLEKEEYLDLLEQHMDMLTSRLNRRGYDCKVKACLRQEGEARSVVDQIIGERNQPVLLSTQAFDMRA